MQMRMSLDELINKQTAAVQTKPPVTALQIPDKFQHIDGDQFYVAIERLHNPALRGVPVVVRYGTIVSASSYEARALGIKAGMPYYKALETAARKKSSLETVDSDMAKYVAVSRAMIQIAKEANPETEIYSIDEVFCRYPQAGWEEVEEAGAAIRARVHRELGVTVSVGNGPTKYIAKMSTKHFKPDKQTTCHNFAEYAAMFGHMVVDDLHGVGGRTAEKLAALNIRTIESLAEREPWELRPAFKEKRSNFLVSAAWGSARWEFVPWYIQAITLPRSVGNTAGIPFRARGSLEATAEALTGAVIMTCSRMQVHNYSGNTLTVGIRHSDSGGMDRTVQQKLNSHTNSEETLAVRAVAMLTRLYREAAAEGMIVNCVGVKVSGIRADMPTQLELAKT